MVGVAVLKKVTLEDQKRKPDQNISKHNSWKRAANREHHIGKYSPGQRANITSMTRWRRSGLEKQNLNLNTISCVEMLTEK